MTLFYADFTRCKICSVLLLLTFCSIGWACDSPAVVPVKELQKEDVRTGNCDRCVLTEHESGGRWIIALSSSASIRLGNDYVWSAPGTDSDQLDLSMIAYESDPGFTEWELRSRQPGLMNVRFTGEPNPPNGKGAPLEIHFEFEFVEY